MRQGLLIWTGALAVSVRAVVQAGQPGRVPAKLFHVRGGLGNVFAKLRGGGAVKVAEINAAIGGAGPGLGVLRCQFGWMIAESGRAREWRLPGDFTLMGHLAAAP